MITGESKPVAKGPGDRVVAGTVSTDSSIRVRVDGGRRRHGAGRDPAAGGRRPGEPQPGPGVGRSVRRAALLRGGGRGGDHLRRVDPARRRRRRHRAHRHRVGDRLPARPRSGDPAGDLAVDRGGGEERDPGQGPTRPGADADHRRRAVRQDRHAHQGRARRHRCRRGKRLRRSRGATPRRWRRVRQRASARPGDRGRGARARRGRHRHQVPRAHRAGRRGDDRRRPLRRRWSGAAARTQLEGAGGAAPPSRGVATAGGVGAVPGAGRRDRRGVGARGRGAPRGP